MYELSSNFKELNDEQLVTISGGGDIIEAIVNATVEGVKGFVEAIDPIIIRPIKIVAAVAKGCTTGDTNMFFKAAWYIDQY